MPKRLTAKEAEAILADPARFERVAQVLRDPPEGTRAASLAKEALRQALTNERMFIGTCRNLPAEAIRLFLAMGRKHRSPYVVFMLAAVDGSGSDAAVTEQWRAALQGLFDIDVSYPMGSKLRRAKLEGLLCQPTIMRAAQALTVSTPEVPMPVLELLVFDGSEESVDALLPFFTRATADKGLALDRLSMLERHARKTPAMISMLAEVSALLNLRNDTSPALRFAEVDLGLGKRKTFRFSARLGSRQTINGGVPRYQGELIIDSQDQHWFRGWVTDVSSSERASTRFGAGIKTRDTLGVGGSEPAGWPDWLARAAKRLKAQWDINAGVRHAPLVERWLRKG